MKKGIVLLLILSLVLCGCTLRAPESDMARFEYPGLKWGMAPGEVLDALGKTDADIIDEYEDRSDDMESDFRQYWMILHEVEAFGQETTAAAFIFKDYTQSGEGFQLVELRFFYPDGHDGSEAADVAALEAELVAFYGPAAKTEHWDPEERRHYEVTEEQPANVFSWDSGLTCWDLLTQEQRDGVYAYYCGRAENPVSLEEFAEDWKGRAFHISLQPYHHRYLAQMGQSIDEEGRSWGVSNVCIIMDAQAYYGIQHTADVWMESE